MYDAVIVLANLMNEIGIPNEESLARLWLACDIVKSNKAAFLVTCGWAYRDDSEMPISLALANYAVSNFGIDPGKIVLETNSRDTVGDAVFTKLNVANQLGWNDLVVVTSDYHKFRTSKIFSFVYGKAIDVHGAPSPEDSSKVITEQDSLNAFQQTFIGIEPGNDMDIYRRLISNHPFYNGKVYPRITTPVPARKLLS